MAEEAIGGACQARSRHDLRPVPSRPPGLRLPEASDRCRDDFHLHSGGLSERAGHPDRRRKPLRGRLQEWPAGWKEQVLLCRRRPLRDYKNGKRDGKGKYFYADGDRYEGDYKDGRMDGKGKYFYANRDHYEGDYKNGRMDGKGRYFYANGSRYEGDYKNDQEDGKGKFFSADGDRYEGDYKDGQRDGKGKYFYADGDHYEGDYKNGRMDGKGKYFYADGDCKECVFKMGEEVRCKKLAKQSYKQS